MKSMALILQTGIFSGCVTEEKGRGCYRQLLKTLMLLGFVDVAPESGFICQWMADG